MLVRPATVLRNPRQGLLANDADTLSVTTGVFTWTAIKMVAFEGITREGRTGPFDACARELKLPSAPGVVATASLAILVMIEPRQAVGVPVLD